MTRPVDRVALPVLHRSHLRRAALLLATTALTSPLLANMVLAQSLPTGGSVAAGSAVISQPSATQLTIIQSSQSAVVNFQSFSVGQGNNVTFTQPNASSAILNRVTGAAHSTIAGSITANGQVYLVNPNGIAITPSGTVNTGGGFVASTLGISDSDFMAGNRTFTGTGASANVSNEGIITVGRGGYAALIGGTVSNSGSIDVPLGKVGLGAGEQATLDFSGDGFLQVAVPTSADGTGALIKTSGTIKADGGSVVISAATAREAARNAINISGTVQATSISGRNGSITIGGGEGGKVKITGKLIARSSDRKGGTVVVTGKTIKLKGATVDASGKTGGGTINIGGGLQGTGPLQRADTTTIDAATIIKADATATGNGGNVVVWSDRLTTFAGTISARGGELSGNGGAAEVSGKASLAYTGFTDLTAANGSFGTLLLDPYNVTISNAADTGGFTANANDSVINVGTLQSALSGASVIVSTGSGGSQTGNITVASPLTWNAGTTLTLNAANSIAVNAGITFGGTAGAGLTLNATNALAINAPIQVQGTGAVTLAFDASSPTNLSFASGTGLTYLAANGNALSSSAGGTLTIKGQPFTLVYSMAELDAIDATEAVGGTAVTRYGTGLSGRYAIAGNLDATGTTYTASVIGTGGSTFTGTLEGLGHSITGLTINAPNTGFVGLVGDSSGILRDIGLIGGSVTGFSNVGGLAGTNEGTGGITQVYSTGDVLGNNSDVGALVGINLGVITQSYATGIVSGSLRVGGLVGSNGGTGAITQSYATGSVSAPNTVGGLVGSNGASSTITQSYATGSVSGSSNSGGLVGINPTGTVTASYWDTQTSGQPTSAGGTGLATAQFQPATLPTGFSSSAWGAGSGLYPYLTNFFPNGVQAVSGIAYKDAGTTPAASGSAGLVTVSLDLNGGLLSQVITGANGYYYVAVANGTIANGAGLLASTPANGSLSTNAATLATSVGGISQGNINLYGNTLAVATSATLLSQVPSLAGARASATTTAGTDSAAAGVVSALATVGYVATGASFSIDTPTTIGSGSGLFVATGVGSPLTVDAAVTVANNGTLGFTSGGNLRINAPITAQGAAGVTFIYDASSPTNLSFASGAGLTYVAANGNPLSSSAGGTLTLNGTPYTLVYSMAELDAIDAKEAVGGTAVTQYGAGLLGNYAIAGNLDATGTTYTNALIGGGVNPFRGTLEGLGHTITGLTINAPSTGFIGLVGDSFGTLRDIGLTGGSVTGSSNVGALVGENEGAGRITQAYSTGNASGSGVVGGLVGLNDGTITQSYATGSVLGSGALADAGGLVGDNSGTITQSYATGNVSGSNNPGGVGGLAGTNSGTITQSYATASVSGTTHVGGLVGGTLSGIVTNSYWDTQTSGQSMSQGGVGGPTALFQSGVMPTGFSAAAWGTGSGLYPYLTSFFPNGVQAVSGFAYTGVLGTPLASNMSGAVTVNVIAGGTSFGSATTGANGYYYVSGAAGSIATNAMLLAYTNANATTGVRNSATLATAANPSIQTGVILYNGALTASTSELTLSAADTTAIAAANAAGTGNAAALSAVSGSTGHIYTATGASFTIDQPVMTSGIFGVITGTGAPLTLSNSITISNGGSLYLLSGGSLGINAPITAKGAAGVTLSYDASLPTNLSFASGAGLSYVAANGNPLSSSAGGTLTLNGTPYTLVYSMAQLDAIDAKEAVGGSAVTQYGTGLSGAYAIAGNLDATGTTYTAAVIGTGGNIFSGILEGLGHTITGLTINAPSTDFIGLVEDSFGTLRDVGLISGSVSGANAVGALVGVNDHGTITQAYSTGSVLATGVGVGGLVGNNSDGGTITRSYATGNVSGSTNVGGLVGANGLGGSITQSYATGSVSGTNEVGGLVGANSLGGSITQSYATGNVSGSIIAGGLVGNNSSGGMIAQSYATGSVSGTSDVGGLVGSNSAATVTNSYWDTQTSGQSTSAGGGTGLTTAQFQSGSLPTGFDASVWSTGNGLYPYLANFFPNGVQAVSGIAYKSDGTVLASGSAGSAVVNLAAGGTVLGSVSTGANGYYYVLLPAGTLASGTQTLAYTVANGTTGAANAATYVTATGGTTVAGTDIHGGWQIDRSGAGIATLSALNTADAGAAGSLLTGFSLANRDIITSATSLALDVGTSLAGTLVLDTGGTVTQNAGVSVNALSLTGGGTFTLTNAGNSITAVAANAGALSLADNGTLTTGSVADAAGTLVHGVTTTGTVSLATTGALTIASGAAVSGTSAALSAGGAFINNAGANAVTATSGRWLVYSANPAGNTFGGLDSGNTAIWNTTGGGTVAQTGNRYVFASQPTLTVTSTSDSKTYGDDITARVAGDYTITGFNAGVAGTYLADTAATALTGSASVTSAGSAATAGVAGSPYAITAAAGTLSATSGYAIQYVSSGNLAVGTRAITVTANSGQSFTYGNTPTIAYTVGGSGLVSGDTLSGALTGITSTTGVGTYAITQGGLTNSANPNYTITSFTGANATVVARAITVTADAKARIYGDANPALTYTVGGLGLVNGDTLSGGLATTATSTSNVGAYAITQGSLVASSNYTLTYAGANLTITARPIIATSISVAADSKSRAYGDANPILTYTASGLVNGDTLSGSLVTTATVTSPVGTYAITQGTLANPNYTITSFTNGTLTVTARPITVTANAQSMVYGNSVPALTYTVGGLGLVNGDTLAGSLATSATATSNVGTYGITQGSLTASSNYALTYSGALLTVGTRAITVAADAQSRAYGDSNPALTYTVGGLGLVNGDTFAGSLATSATATSNVGIYGIAQGSLTASSNYALTYSGSLLTVGTRALTVTADAKSRIYGDANPALTCTVGGLVNGDTLAGALATSATATSNVGIYGITQGSLTASSNYALTYSGSLLTVGTRAITVTADAQSRAYGDANPALTYTVGGLGLVNGDRLAGSLATSATATSNVGTYGITQGSLTASSNYALTYSGALLTVQPSVQPPPRPQGSPAIDPSLLASSVVRDNFHWIALPDDAKPVAGVLQDTPPSGVDVVYSDPRFDRSLICFAGGGGAAASCFTAGR